MHTWERLHTEKEYRDRMLPETIARFWDDSETLGVDWQRPEPPVFKDGDFAQVKRTSIKLYAYANRFISQMMEFLFTPTAAFALFNSEGCLLKLYGAQETLDSLAARGIARMGDWSISGIGASAVCIGLRENRALEVSGAQNYSRALLDYAVYFAPISLEEPDTNIPHIYGGLAILLPIADARKDFLLVAAAAANDIELHLFMADTLHQVYLEEERAILAVDINLHTGKTNILYHNTGVFKIFGIPYSDFYFKPVDSLFDPLPANREFWSILQNRRRITDETITLSVKGSAAAYHITTDPYLQNKLGLAGIRFYITSPKLVSSGVSRRIGNNARLTFSDIVGKADGTRSAIRNAKIIARSDSNVLILGESGVGKDIFAQAIHNASKRRDRPFIAVNCAALPRDLIASELFGYDGGAFTGSKRSGNIGKFELADTGTIFLDEIGDLPLDLQAVLLRAIEQKTFMRIGSSTETYVDVKIIAATNADLTALVEQKKFRADLYYRLSTLRLNLLPLRERREDIIPLAEHFICMICARIGQDTPIPLSNAAKALLCSLPWRGNVRELQNLVEGIVQLYSPHIIDSPHIREYLGLSDVADSTTAQPPNTAIAGPNTEKERIEQALRACRYNRTKTAQYLGISRKTLYRRLDELNISLD